MRVLILGFLTCFCLLTPSRGDDAKDKNVVKELEARGIKPELYRNTVKKPLVVKEMNLGDVFVEDAKAAIQKQVNWKDEFVLVFAWSGSGQDKLRYEVKPGKTVEVMFYHKPGLTRDLRRHGRVFVLPQGATWKVESVRQ